MARQRSLVGMRFAWVIVTREYLSQDGDRAWLFRCDCGERRWTSERCLLTGEVVSCGCRSGQAPERNPRKAAEYRIWLGMRSRCYSPNVFDFRRYGRRGILICDHWRRSFENFLTDVGCRPSDGLTLDRIDNDGHYEPGNWRWATRREQANNRANNHRLTFRDETRTMAEWARLVGISQSELRRRLVEAEWPLERALTERPRGRNRRGPVFPPGRAPAGPGC